MQAKDFTSVLTAFVGGDVPDLLMLSDVSRAYELATAGELMPLEELIERDGISTDIFLDTAIESGTFDGTLYCLPHMGFSNGLYWNKDLFEEAGLDPETPPKTAEELLEFANKLNKVDEDGNIIQLGYSPQYSGGGLWTNAWGVPLFGGSVYDTETGEYTLTDEGFIKTFEWNQSFNADLDPQDVANFVASAGGSQTTQDLFFAGKLAMASCGCWVGVSLNNTDINYGVAGMPASEAVLDQWPEGIIGMAYNPYVIPAKSGNVEAAWDFMKFMLMDKEMCSRWEDVTANMSHLKDTDTEYVGELRQSDYFKTFSSLAKTSAYSMPLIPTISEYSTKVSAIFDEVIMNKDADVKALLEQAQAELN